MGIGVGRGQETRKVLMRWEMLRSGREGELHQCDRKGEGRILVTRQHSGEGQGGGGEERESPYIKCV